MTIQEFKEKAFQVHKNKFDYSKVSFKRVTDKILIICPIHGEFKQRVNLHLKGYDCKRCSAEKGNEDRKITFEKFVEKANIKHNNYFTYFKDFYSNFKTETKIRCPIHGEFFQKPSIHLQGYGCPKCAVEKSKQNHKFNKFKSYIKQINNLGFNTSLVSFEKYKEYNTKFQIICKKHGSFEKSLPETIKSGCPQCNYERVAEKNRLSHKEIIERFRNTHKDIYNYSAFTDHKRIDENISIICPVHGEFTQRIDNHMNGCGCPLCSIGSSKYEEEISDFIKSLGITNILYRKRFDNKEFDIYLPDFKLAIEFNGLMDHSIGYHSYSRFNNEYNKKNINRHLEKTEIAEKYNIQLFHIFEDSWISHKEIWKSMIKNKLGLSEKIYARKCQAKEILKKESKFFLEENHLQGDARASIKIGLFYNNELVSVMTFMKPRYNTKYDYELIRFATKKDYSIIGGASKLLKYFRERYSGSIISYANRSWSKGDIYEKLGFSFSHKTHPNHTYFKQEEMIRYPREKFQKHKQKDILEKFDPNLTGIENMLLNNYRIVFDSGQLVYTLE